MRFLRFVVAMLPFIDDDDDELRTLVLQIMLSAALGTQAGSLLDAHNANPFDNPLNLFCLWFVLGWIDALFGFTALIDPPAAPLCRRMRKNDWIASSVHPLLCRVPYGSFLHYYGTDTVEEFGQRLKLLEPLRALRLLLGHGGALLVIVRLSSANNNKIAPEGHTMNAPKKKVNFTRKSGACSRGRHEFVRYYYIFSVFFR